MSEKREARSEKRPCGSWNFFVFYFLLSLPASPPSLPALWAAQSPSKLHSPVKISDKGEAVLFKGLSGQLSGVGLVTAEDKRLMRDTIEKEKNSILRRTMQQIYGSAFDLYRQGRYQEAIDILNRVVILDPSFEQARALHSALSSAGAGRGQGVISAPKSVRDIIRDKFYEAVQV